MADSKIAQDWFDFAESDYKYALLGSKEEIVYSQVAFLSQQVVEKYLKGFLLKNEIDPKRTHELPELLDEIVKINKGFESIRKECELLTGFYFETRYPPDVEDYTKEQILTAFEAAERVHNFFQNIIVSELHKSQQKG